jgi:hypothetical protein
VPQQTTPQRTPQVALYYIELYVLVSYIVIQLYNLNQQTLDEHILPPARLFIKMYEKYTIKIACTNGLPDDEHVMFQTCRRRQELNINFKSVHFLVYVT